MLNMKYRKIDLCLSIIFILFVNDVFAKNLVLNVNTKKPIAITSEKFLSLTIDPISLVDVNNDLLGSIDKSSNLARALSPGYVRFAGPRSNFYKFERALYPREDRPDANFRFSDTHWMLLQEWAKKSGLDVISCVASQGENDATTQTWDSKNARDLISFYDSMNYNSSWQLGYECQSRCNISGKELGENVLQFREMLDASPNYSKSILIGPDIINYETEKDQKYLNDYFEVAGQALSAITWHPDFPGATLDGDVLSIERENLSSVKDDLYKVLPASVTNKALWIAESKPEIYKKQFLGALLWTRRLGDTAKLGAEVLMRQPSDLFHATPDYWVSLLHKTLVGPEVLDANIQNDNESNVHFYCQCTKPSVRYTKGAVTIFGVNLSPTKATVHLKGIKNRILHKYILSSDSDENPFSSDRVLLNGMPLELLHNNEIPDISPLITASEKGLDIKLPSGGIGFWVIPDIKIKSCIGNSDEASGNLVNKKMKEKEESPAIEEHRQDSKRGKQINEDKVENENQQKLKTVGARKELQKLERFLRKRLAAQDSIKKTENVNKKIQNEDEIKSKEPSDVATDSTSRKKRETSSYDSSQQTVIKKADEVTEKLGNKWTKTKRDLDKKFTVDPSILNSKRESIFKKRSKIDDERRTDRKIKRKDETKREYPSLLEARNLESDENNFYGFFKREPPANFPKGDLYLITGSSEETDKDYDYVKDDDEIDDREIKIKSQNPSPKNIENPETDFDDTWIEEESDYRSYVPNEFFENVKMPSIRFKTEMNDFTEISEMEAAEKGYENQEIPKEQQRDIKIFKQREPNEEEEREARERTLKKLVNYYADVPNKKSYPFGEIASMDLRRFQTKGSTVKFPNDENFSGRLDEYSQLWRNEKDVTINRRKSTASMINPRDEYPTTMDFDESDAFPFDRRIYDRISNRRTKRNVADELNALLDREMINQDDDNTRDCQCRVIRSHKSVGNGNNEDVTMDSLRESQGTTSSDSKVDTKVGSSVDSPIAFHSRKETKRTGSPINARVKDKIRSTKKQQLDSTPSKDNGNPDFQTEETLSEIADEVDEKSHRRDVNRESEEMARHKKRKAESSEGTSTLALGGMPETPEIVNQNSEKFLYDHSSHETPKGTFFLEKEEETSTSDPVKGIQEDDPRDQKDSSRYTEENLSSIEKQITENPENIQTNPEAEDLKISDSTFDPAATSKNQDDKPSILQSIHPPTDQSQSNQTGDEETENCQTDENPENPEESSDPLECPRTKKPPSKSSDSVKGKTLNLADDLVKAREARVLARTEALFALKKEIEEKRSGKPDVKNIEYQKRRAEQLEKLKEKLRAKRERLLLQHKLETQSIETDEDEDKRNLRRRATWEELEGEDIHLQDILDPEKKVTYILMHKPIDYSVIKKEKGPNQVQSMANRYVPVVEISRPLHSVRNRTIDPKDQYRRFKESDILKCVNCDGPFDHQISLNYPENEFGIREKYSDDKRGSGKSYYALIDDPDDPWMFQYWKKPQKERNEEIHRSVSRIDWANQDLKNARDNEDSNDEKSSQRKIYILDPTMYKGGEPILQAIPDDSPKNKKQNSGNVYRLAWQPDANSQYKTNQQKILDFQENPQLSEMHLARLQRPSYEKSDTIIKTLSYPGQSKKNTDLLYDLNANMQYDFPMQYIYEESLKALIDALDRRYLNRNNLKSRDTNVSEKIKKKDEPEDARSEIENTNFESKIVNEKDVVREELQPEIIYKDIAADNNRNSSNVKNVSDVEKNFEEIQQSQEHVDTDDQLETHENISDDLEITEEEQISEEISDLDQNDKEEATNRRKRRDIPVLIKDEFSPFYVIGKVPYKFEKNQEKKINLALEGEKKKYKNPKYESLVFKSNQDLHETNLNNGDDNSEDKSLNHEDLQELLDIIDASQLKLLTESSDQESDETENTSDFLQKVGNLESIENYYDDSELNESDEIINDSLEQSQDNSNAESEETNENYEIAPIRKNLNIGNILNSNKGIFMLLPYETGKLTRQRRQIENLHKGEDVNKVWLLKELISPSELNINGNRLNTLGKNKGENHILDLNHYPTKNHEILELFDDSHNDLYEYFQDGKFKDTRIKTDLLNIILAPENLGNSIESAYNDNFLDNNFKQDISDLSPDKKDKNQEDNKNGIVESTLPKIEDTIVGGLEKVQNLTESLEEFVDNFDEKFNETLTIENNKDKRNDEEPNPTHDFFGSVIMNIKKFFTFFSGFIRLLHP